MIKSIAQEEKRYWVRAKRVLSIQFRLVRTRRKDVDMSWQLSTTQDMSLGGVAFYTEKEYKTGEILEIHIIMSGLLDIFKGHGRLVRIEKKKSAAHYLVGVQFVEKKKGPVNRLTRF